MQNTEKADIVERLKADVLAGLNDYREELTAGQIKLIADDVIRSCRAALAAEKERCATFADERKEAALSRMRSAATEDARLLYDMEQATAGGIADAIRATE